MLSLRTRWLIAGSAFLLSAVPAFAQQENQESIQDKINQAKAEIRVLFGQWRQDVPQQASTGADFQSYLMSKRALNEAYGQTLYNSFTHRFYQPVYILPSGAWIMGFDPGKATIALYVDVNGNIPPGYRGASAEFDQKELILDAQGQVVQVLD